MPKSTASMETPTHDIIQLLHSEQLVGAMESIYACRASSTCWFAWYDSTAQCLDVFLSVPGDFGPAKAMRDLDCPPSLLHQSQSVLSLHQDSVLRTLVARSCGPASSKGVDLIVAASYQYLESLCVRSVGLLQ
jgi:hypothetical protein